MVVQPDHLLRRVLQVVVHRDHVGAAGMPQSGHDRIVLAVIARVFDVDERDGGAAHQFLAHLAGIVGAAVIDQHDLQPADRVQCRQGIDQPSDRGGAAINRDHDGQADVGACASSAPPARPADRPADCCRRSWSLRGRQHRATRRQGEWQMALDLCHGMERAHRAMAETRRHPRRRRCGPAACAAPP